MMMIWFALFICGFHAEAARINLTFSQNGQLGVSVNPEGLAITNFLSSPGSATYSGAMGFGIEFYSSDPVFSPSATATVSQNSQSATITISDGRFVNGYNARIVGFLTIGGGKKYVNNSQVSYFLNGQALTRNADGNYNLQLGTATPTPTPTPTPSPNDNTEVRFIWDGFNLSHQIRSTGIVSGFLVGAPANLKITDFEVGGNTMFLSGAPYRIDESWLFCDDFISSRILLGVSDGRDGDGRNGERAFFPINSKLTAQVNSFVWKGNQKFYFDTSRTKFFLNGAPLSLGSDNNYDLNLSGSPVLAQVHYWWDGHVLEISTNHKGLDPAYIGVQLPPNAPSNLVQALGSYIWPNFDPWQGHQNGIVTIPADGESARFKFTDQWINVIDWCTFFTFRFTPELQVKVNPTFAWQWHVYSYNLNTTAGFLNGIPLQRVRNSDNKESFLLNLPGSVGATLKFTSSNSVAIDRGNQKLEHLFFNVPTGTAISRVGIIHFQETGSAPFAEEEVVAWNGQSATIGLAKFRSDNHRVSIVGFDAKGNRFFGNVLMWTATIDGGQPLSPMDGAWELLTRSAVHNWNIYE